MSFRLWTAKRVGDRPDRSSSDNLVGNRIRAVNNKSPSIIRQQWRSSVYSRHVKTCKIGFIISSAAAKIRYESHRLTFRQFSVHFPLVCFAGLSLYMSEPGYLFVSYLLKSYSFGSMKQRRSLVLVPESGYCEKPYNEKQRLLIWLL